MFQEAIAQYLKQNHYESIQLKSVLFDMDGVLFDSMPYHAEAWHKTMKAHGKRTNLEVVKTILKALDKPESLIKFVTDRPGHDMRYAIDPTKIHNELGWLPETKFADGIKKTIKWYLDNKEWWETIISGEYQNYYEKMYANRGEA